MTDRIGELRIVSYRTPHVIAIQNVNDLRVLAQISWSFTQSQVHNFEDNELYQDFPLLWWTDLFF